MKLSSIMAAIAAFLFIASLVNSADARPKHHSAHRHSAQRVANFNATDHCQPDNNGRVICWGAPAKPQRQALRAAPRHRSGIATGGGLGLVTVATAAGIDITVSADFAPLAQAAIAAAVADGRHFRRINCYDLRSTHKALSNHKTGDACDAYPSIPARIVRAAGLRSGCDFADCPHFDNARNVGGVAFWNSVKHRGPTVTASADRRHHRRIRMVRR